MSEHAERPIIEDGSGNVFADLGLPNPEDHAPVRPDSW